MNILPPYQVQQRASDAAYALRQEYAGRLSLEQNIKMEVISLAAPERLGWAECGEALAMYSLVVVVRV